MNIVLTVGDLVLPLCCKRCGFRVAFIVGDDESEGRAAADMAIHDAGCQVGKKEQVPS